MIWEERLSGEEERREAWKVRRWVVRWATPCVLRGAEGEGGRREGGRGREGGREVMGRTVRYGDHENSSKFRSQSQAHAQKTNITNTSVQL